MSFGSTGDVGLEPRRFRIRVLAGEAQGRRTQRAQRARTRHAHPERRRDPAAPHHCALRIRAEDRAAEMVGVEEDDACGRVSLASFGLDPSFKCYRENAEDPYGG